MHTDHSDLVLDEEGALETKVSAGKRGAPFTVSPAPSPLLFPPFSFWPLGPSTHFLFFLILSIYLVVLGLSCGMQDLRSLLPYAGFFFSCDM